MLALCGVTYAYGSRSVLRDVTVAVAAGEIVFVIGPNGAGKTTLLRLAAGLLAPSAGTVRVGGTDPGATPRRALATRLAFLPQEYALAFPFTVAEVVLMGRYPYRRPGSLLETDADVALAEEAMERCDVARLAARRFDELSGGERRRTLLAQAFCQASPLVLLDEPTAALDPAHAIAVFRVLAEEKAARRAAALVVTHDLNLAARFADRVVLLADGGVACQGTPSEVLRTPAAAGAFGVNLLVGSLPSGAAPFAVPW